LNVNGPLKPLILVFLNALLKTLMDFLSGMEIKLSSFLSVTSQSKEIQFLKAMMDGLSFWMSFPVPPRLCKRLLNYRHSWEKPHV